MAEPVYLCAACRAELEIAGDTGRCPDCGTSEDLDVIEAEAERALIEKGLGQMRQLDPDAAAGEGRRAPRHRFTVKL